MVMKMDKRPTGITTGRNKGGLKELVREGVRLQEVLGAADMGFERCE